MKGIVFEGGGASVYCHIGALKYIEKNKNDFEYIAGSSSGSIIAVFYGAGYTVDKLIDICCDFKIPNINIFKGLYNLIYNYGWFSTDVIADIIKKYFGEMTLTEYEEKYKKKLIITACKDFAIEYFDSNNGNHKLYDIVASSCAFPFIFARRNGYSDGGIIANFPYSHLANKIGEKNILGIYIKRTDEFSPKQSKNIFEFTINLFNTLISPNVYETYDKSELKNIIIINTSVKTFDIGQIKKGIKDGYKATKKYFS